MNGEQLLTAADAARLLEVVPATVRQLASTGKLPCQRTERGLRLFRRADVEQLVREREGAKRQPVRGKGTPHD